VSFWQRLNEAAVANICELDDVMLAMGCFFEEDNLFAKLDVSMEELEEEDDDDREVGDVE